MEIENSKNNENNDIAEHICDKFDFLYCKNDGSLNSGFEIVTHPMSSQYLNDNKYKFSQLLDYLSKNGYTSYQEGTCGIHIHISKSAFTTLHLYKFLAFFYNHPKYITKISQRTTSQLNQWARLDDDQKQIIYKAKNKNQDTSRYAAINLKNSKTVEVRIFRGTLKPMSFFKNIEFIQAIIEYTKMVSVSDNNLKHFQAWIKANSQKYPNLFNFLKIKNLLENTEI